MGNLLLSEDELNTQNFEFFKINRGGDITYHGPGQITGYPIFDLDDFFTDVHKYVRYLEEVIIKTIAHYGILGVRIEGYTGVWVKPEKEDDPYRKICAIGVHLSRWVTMHGFALNVQPNLKHFNNIIPCGIEDKDKVVTSIEREIDYKVSVDEVKLLLKNNFAELFEYTYLPEH
jgi:lipoyl(octanoyl) transferase